MVTRRRQVASWLASSLVLALALVLVAPAGEGQASGRSFRLVSLYTDAVVTPDGDMHVVEQVTYRFDGGPFTIGIRSFESDLERITDFTVTEDGSPRRVSPPSITPTGQWEWFLGGQARNETRTYEVRYRVVGAVSVGPDVGELYWQFIGKDHPGIGEMQVRVHVPGTWPLVEEGVTADDDATVLRVWGHGPATGRVDPLPDGAFAVVTGVPASRFVELRLAVPAAAFDVAPTGGPRLATILAEERSYLDQLDREQQRRDLARIFAPFAAVMGLVATGFLWFAYGREPKPTEQIGQYWREPLTDPPAVVLKNLRRRGFPAGQAIGATIIDLAQRGYLTISAEHQKRLGPDRTVHTFHRTDKPDTDLAAFEQRLLKMVLRGQQSMSADDLTAWGKKHREQASKQLEAFTKAVTEEYERRGHGTGLPWQGALLLVGAALLVAGVGYLALRWDQPLGWVAIVAAPVMLLVGFPLLWNRNQHSGTEVVRAQATRRFLTDFSNLGEAPVGHLILWERHLVDAVTLGVSKQLLDGLAVRLPQMVDDPTFAAWYAGAAVGSRRRIDGVGIVGASVGSEIASSFQPPSSSGSGGGGGFSGGGGGGGGGGGFGAR